MAKDYIKDYSNKVLVYLFNNNEKTVISYSKIKYGEYAQALAELSLEYKIRYQNYIVDEEDYSILKIYCNEDKMYYHFIIDTEDVNKISNIKWGVHKDKRTYKNISNRVVARNFEIGLLHRYILDLEDQDCIIDHRNRNTFDNRKANLRIVNNSINQKNKCVQKNNTSGYPGVKYGTSNNCWTASIINENGKRITKSFSVSKYGKEARQLAIEWRQNNELKHGYNVI